MRSIGAGAAGGVGEVITNYIIEGRPPFDMYNLVSKKNVRNSTLVPRFFPFRMSNGSYRCTTIADSFVIESTKCLENCTPSRIHFKNTEPEELSEQRRYFPSFAPLELDSTRYVISWFTSGFLQCLHILRSWATREPCISRRRRHPWN